MEKQNKNNNGFLMGFLLGMAAALLVTTKKGRRILRNFSENGWEKIGSLEDILKKTLNEAQDEFIDGDKFLIEDIQDEIKNKPNEEKIPSENESLIKAKVEDFNVEVEKNENKDDENTSEKVDTKNNEPIKKEEIKDRIEVSPFRKAKANTKRFFRGIKKRTA